MQRANVVKLGRWVEQMWKDKDRLIGELLAREAGVDASPGATSGARDDAAARAAPTD